MDLASFLKAGLKELQSKRFTYKHSDAEKQIERRRSSRIQTLMALRGIREDTSTSIKCSSHVQPQKNNRLNEDNKNDKVELVKIDEKSDNRKALLMKWKEERSKRIEAEKNKRKPIFKVSHHMELPGIEEANQLIKGKRITTKSNTNTSGIFKFAPKNHVFRPPANIKPIYFKDDIERIEFNLPVTKEDISLSNKGKHKLENKKKMYVKRNDKENGIKLKTTTTKLSKSKGINDNRENRKNISILKQDTQITTNIKKKTKLPRELPLKEHDSSKKSTLKRIKSPSENNLNTLKNNCVNVKLENSGKTKYTKKPTEKTYNWNCNDLRQKSKNKYDYENNLLTKCNDKNTSVKSINREKNAGVKKKVISISETSSSSCVEEQILENKRNISLSSEHLIDRCMSSSSDSYISTLNENKIKEKASHLNDSVFIAKDISQPDIKTPNYKNSPIYISPYVTVSRGKESARKEFKERLSKGGTFESSDASKYTSPKAAASYFTEMLNKEIAEILTMCETWEKYKLEKEIPDGADDMINVAIGQSQLLINQKLEQFRGLIKSANNKENRVTCQDLHGFWDLVNIQINNVKDRFANLDKLKNNNWEEILCLKNKTPVKKKVIAQKVNKKKINSKIKDLIKEMKHKKNLECENKFTGFEKTLNNSNLIQKGSLQVNTETHINSPGLTILKASHSAKKLQESLNSSTPISLQKITPARSILKSGSSKSSRKKHKSVLFFPTLPELENLHTEDNLENNLNIGNCELLKLPENIFSPELRSNVSLRRSARLSGKLLKNKLFQ